MSAHRLERLEHHEVTASAGFGDWLAEQGVSLVLTHGNRLFLVGLRADGSLSVVERGFPHVTAVAALDDRALLLATAYQVWRLQDALPAGERTEVGADRLFVPQTAWTTGSIGIQDLAVDGLGRPVFVSQAFSCLATVSETLSFEPVWKPPFVSVLDAGERCGLSGLVVRDGVPAYVTSASRSDEPGGWRAATRHGGVVLSVPDGEVVASGLSLPGSPLLDGDALLLCNGGTGELGRVDPASGGYEAVAGLPGLTRGLARHGTYAVVGTSRRPWDTTYGDVEVEDRLARTGTASVCGLHVVDLRTGTVEHSLVVAGIGPDLADVAVLPGVTRPDAVGYRGDDVENLVTFRI